MASKLGSLGTSDKDKVCMCSIQVSSYFSNMCDLVESVTVKPSDIKD